MFSCLPEFLGEEDVPSTSTGRQDGVGPSTPSGRVDRPARAPRTAVISTLKRQLAGCHDCSQITTK
ncbi:MAG: hypothetical protein GY861_07945 [bacterium]|nr:hypothetical protein [bacterium]